MYEGGVSYDFLLFATRGVSRSVLAELAAGVGADFRAGQGSWEVVDRWGRLLFGGSGPDPMEPDDLPEELVGSILAPAWVFSVVVEGSGQRDVAVAERFCRALARQADAVVYDQQRGMVLVKGKSRMGAGVPRGARRPLAVEFQWYSMAAHHQRLDATMPQEWVRLGSRFVPEVLPVRFGRFEPLRYRLARDGLQTLDREWAEPDGDMVGFTATAPFLDGTFGRTPAFLESSGRYETANVRCQAVVFDNPGWTSAVKRFFIAFAAQRRCFHACAVVLPGQTDPDYDMDGVGRTLLPLNSWFGLQPEPSWWNWFGGSYATLARERVPAHLLEHHPGGLFYAAAPNPRQLGSRTSDEDPLAKLRAGTNPPEPKIHDPTLYQATVLPPDLN